MNKTLIKLTVEEADAMYKRGEKIDFDKYDIEGPNEWMIRKVYESVERDDKK